VISNARYSQDFSFLTRISQNRNTYMKRSENTEASGGTDGNRPSAWRSLLGAMSPLLLFPLLFALANNPETPLIVSLAGLSVSAFGAAALMAWGEYKQRPLAEAGNVLLAAGKTAAVVFAPYGVLSLVLQFNNDRFLVTLQRFLAQPRGSSLLPIDLLLNVAALLWLGSFLARLAHLRMANGQWIAVVFAFGSLMRLIGGKLAPQEATVLTIICCALTIAGLCLLSPVAFTSLRTRVLRDFSNRGAGQRAD